MKRIITTILICIGFVISTAAPSEATTYRSCGFVDGAVYGRVAVKHFPHRAPKYRRIVYISAKTRYYETRSGPDKIWRLRYVGFHGSKRELYPYQLPTYYSDYNVKRTWQFYFEAEPSWLSVILTSYVSCTVTI